MDLVEKTQKKVESSKKKLSKTIELKSYRKLAVNFLILTVNLIIIILYFSLSQAKIMIVPAKEEVEHSITIPIKEQVSLTDKELAVAGNITNIDVQDSKNFPVKSASSVPKTAKGMITIFNTTSNKNQTFVKNTRFQNQASIEIKIDKQIRIAPKSSIEVSAYASEPGISGEVKTTDGKFQVAALPYLKDKIYAEVSQDFIGGSVDVKVVSPSVFNNAKDSIESSLIDKAYETLSQTNSNIEKDSLIVEITNLESDANPGDENIENFTLSAKAKVSYFTYDSKRAEEIIKQELLKKIPPDKILIGFTEGPSLSISDDSVNVLASAKASIQRKIPEAALNQEDIVGMNEDEVREHFTRITGIRDVKINFWPFWVRSVPNLTDHVDIEIKK